MHALVREAGVSAPERANAKGAEARVLKVDRPPAAKPNAGAELVICDAAKANCEPLPEYEEIRFHTSDASAEAARKIPQRRRKRNYGATS